MSQPPEDAQTLRYPESEHPILAELPSRYELFEAAREAFLLDYGYHTARAYWGDLDDIWRWAEQRGKDVMTLTEQDIKQYLALLKRRKYSLNTVRRRRTAWRGFVASRNLELTRGEQGVTRPETGASPQNE